MTDHATAGSATRDREAETSAIRIETGGAVTPAAVQTLARAVLGIAELTMPDTFFATDPRCRLARAVLAHPPTAGYDGTLDLGGVCPEALVETLHPDGDLNGDHSTEAAFLARELLRYLCHAAQGTDVTRSVPDPWTAATLIALTGQMAANLGELARHLAARGRGLGTDPRATVDAAGREHGGPDTVAELAATNLESAATRLDEAAAGVRTARSFADSLTFGEKGHDCD